MKLREEGLSASTANHYVKTLRRALNLAVEWELIDRNPISGMKLFREDNQVNNFMDDEELKRFVHVLKTDRNQDVCQIILFLLSTGARLNEALKAKWKHIDPDKKTWTIPMEHAKSRRERVCPLNSSALDVLNALHSQGRYEHLFVNRKTKQRYVSINRQWDRIRKKAGLNIRIHDMRHQAASMLINSGRTLFEVGQILGHSDPKVTQRYAHLQVSTMLDAANTSSETLQSAMPKAS